MNLTRFFRRIRKKNKLRNYVSNTENLTFLDRHLKNSKIIGIDTEFDWRTTYFPVLSLIQISTIDMVFVIDCLHVNPEKILRKYLEGKDILKIFHSARSDTTVLSKCLKIHTENTYDIQIAEKLLLGEIQSYAKIVDNYFGTFLNKSETNSNWLRRPLSENQIKYAFNDVDYLIEVFCLQKKKLLKQNLLSKTFNLSEKESFLGNKPLKSTRLERIKNKLSDKSIKVFLWREKIAEEKNVPPSFIFKDKYISKLSKINKNNNDTKRKVMTIIGDSELTENFILSI